MGTNPRMKAPKKRRKALPKGKLKSKIEFDEDGNLIRGEQQSKVARKMHEIESKN